MLPLIVHDTAITEALSSILMQINQGKAGHKSEDLSKMEQNNYNSAQNAELYAAIMVLRDVIKSLSIVTDSQYAERIFLHIETTVFISDDTELTLLFIQVQDNEELALSDTHITHPISCGSVRSSSTR